MSPTSPHLNSTLLFSPFSQPWIAVQRLLLVELFQAYQYLHLKVIHQRFGLHQLFWCLAQRTGRTDIIYSTTRNLVESEEAKVEGVGSKIRLASLEAAGSEIRLASSEGSEIRSAALEL
jgi:hypothetical protein